MTKINRPTILQESIIILTLVNGFDYKLIWSSKPDPLLQKKGKGLMNCAYKFCVTGKQV